MLRSKAKEKLREGDGGAEGDTPRLFVWIADNWW